MEIKSYQIELEIDWENRKYFGKEVINLVLEKNYPEFFIDSVDLKINLVKINEVDTSFKINEKNIVLNNLPSGENKIYLEFEGELKESLGGIYLSKYKEQEEKEKYLITTQFEPIEARKAFPCIDHPGYKAVFDLTLIIPKDLKAVSNTLPIKEEIIGNKKKVVFESTPKMSTYLLYIGIGDFYFREDKYKDILLRTVFTPKEKEKAVDFALENTKKFLSYLEEYFAEPYPLKKLDLIAIPDFAAGAMENWGAITFRENLLLVFEGITPLANKQRIAEVIAHELVHMWFGNLVTMKWWEDLWLNESFATYLVYKAVNHFYPEWRIQEEYVFSEVFSALDADALINSHPIKVEIKNPEESMEIFDEISYEKGGSVLRMIENYLGEENFKKGLRNYIKKYKYQNASADDLWESLEEISGENITQIMKDFMEKTGYPKVKVYQEKEKYYLSQERFLFLESTTSETWKIPMVISLDSQEQRLIFKDKSQELTVKENWQTLILNKNYSGFYLSEYSEEILKKNLENKNRLSEIDLLHLLHDYWFLVRRGEKKINSFYSILENDYLKKFYPFVYSEILSILNGINYFLEDAESEGLIEKFAFKVIEHLGKEPRKNELPWETRLRESALISLGKIKNDEILSWSKEKFEKFLENSENLHPDLRLTIINNAVFIHEDNVDRILEYFRKIDLIEEKNRCLMALGSSLFDKKLKIALDFILGPEVRFNQVPFFLRTFANNKISKNFGFAWLKENFAKLEEKGGGPGESDFVLIRILKWTIPTLGVFAQEEMLKEFFESPSLQRFAKTIKIIEEKVKIYKNFLKQNLSN